MVRLKADISMIVVCCASDVALYDVRRSELSNALTHMK